MIKPKKKKKEKRQNHKKGKHIFRGFCLQSEISYFSLKGDLRELAQFEKRRGNVKKKKKDLLVLVDEVVAPTDFLAITSPRVCSSITILAGLGVYPNV